MKHTVSLGRDQQLMWCVQDSMSALTCASYLPILHRLLCSVKVRRLNAAESVRRRRFDSGSGTYVPHEKQWIKQAVAQRLLATAVRR